jgi:hypothetical protein
MTEYQQPEYTPRTFDEEGVKRENALQEHIIDRLVLEQGYLRRTGSARSNNNYAPVIDYDKALAMARELVLRFIQATQPEAWEKLTQHYSASAEDVAQTVGKGAEGPRRSGRAAQGHQDRSRHPIRALLFPASERFGTEAHQGI